MNDREKKLEAAAKRAIPWLVLLGDYIGNGVLGDENGRCNTIAALSEALGDADDVPRALPSGARATRSEDATDEYVNALVEATIAYDAQSGPGRAYRDAVVAALPKGAQRLIENARGKGG